VKNKLPVWAFRFKKLRQPEKTIDFQENACRLSQILKSSLPEKVCPLMKETIRMMSCGTNTSFFADGFFHVCPNRQFIFRVAPKVTDSGRRWQSPFFDN